MQLLRLRARRMSPLVWRPASPHIAIPITCTAVSSSNARCRRPSNPPRSQPAQRASLPRPCPSTGTPVIDRGRQSPPAAMASSAARLPPPPSAAAASGGRGSGVAVAPHAHCLQRSSSSLRGISLQQRQSSRRQQRRGAGRPAAVAAPAAPAATTPDRFGQDDWWVAAWIGDRLPRGNAARVGEPQVHRGACSGRAAHLPCRLPHSPPALHCHHPSHPPTHPTRRDAFLSGYRSCYHERSYWVDDSMVEGTIPAELEGTLLRNGPGLFEVGGKKVRRGRAGWHAEPVQPAVSC